MNGKIFFLVFVVLFVFFEKGKTQKIVKPYIGSKTHPTLTIDSIVIAGGQTFCYLNIVNQSTEGNAWFCADEHISLYELNSGVEHKMIRSEGIPVCPDIHRFSYEGDELHFLLVFPAIDDFTGELDLIENCPDHCFSLKQIVLDNGLNKELKIFEEGVSLFQNRQYLAALKAFQELSQSAYKKENHYAYTMYILPVIYLKMGDTTKARQAYSDLKEATITDKRYFLKKIHEIPFFKAME